MEATKVEAEKARKYMPHFNFIFLHYCYIIGMIIICSIMLYPIKNIAYIDALFFAAGSCTQSGLNTVDLNSVKTYQQIVVYLFPMLTTPIFINTCVVYVRLHWFEKRFKNIVRIAQQPSRARSISLSQDLGRENPGMMERGVRGRNIRVLHQDTTTSGTYVEEPDEMLMQSTHSKTSEKHSPASSIQKEEVDGRIPSPGASSSTIADPLVAEGATGSLPNAGNSTVQFGVSSPRDGSDDNTHIAFVESQREPQYGKALRIPGPREFEKGQRAREVDDDDTYTLGQSRTGEDMAIQGGGSPPPRSYSFGNAATNASSFMRMRRLPTVDRILPTATTVMSTAFSVGTATHRKNNFNLFPKKAVKEMQMPYLSYQPAMGRNSQFVDLNEEQRDELGGIEYRSLKLLGRILCGYYLFFHVFGILCIVPWIYNAPERRAYVNSIGVSPGWWATFTAQTAFNNVGFSLTPDSMLSFQDATWVLLSCTFLIVIGNTGFPCLLRFLIWVFFKITPKGSAIKESLNFLLDHPRRCFTLLFPSRESWVLFWVLVGLNVADVILFIVLDLKDPDVTTIAVGHRIVDGIFQAAATRTVGLAVVNISALHPAVQVSYMLMMYISVFPIAISVRRTNVYEERSLGVYGGDDEEDDGSSASYVGIHLRKQLSFDLWYVFLGLFIICIAEGNRIEDPKDYAFTIFSVLFEVVSAYGTVGLSMGYPNFNPSFAGQFNVVSKLVIIAMQIRGRHRGLPYELDRAILLPKEQRDAELTSIRRRNSNLSTAISFSRTVPSQPVVGDGINQINT